ncbi:pesticidial crystal protein, partial [Bacillus toyonensis]|nr:pesticidial crystal protein [Bacillus toyonensis]
MKNTLKLETTDYEIDQAAISIECMSNEQNPQEKMILWDEVKQAKQLSQSRNLLYNGDFEDASNGWKTSYTIEIGKYSSIFKGQYLHMFGARDVLGEVFPTYVYQKIDESKLKPYTRYRVRGFVGSSKDLKLVVTRYGKEIDAIMDVPDDLAYMQPTPSCGDYRCESASQYVSQGYPTPYGDGYASDRYACPSDRVKKHVKCHNRHPFDFHIDTGELDINTNVGIWVLFKISNPDGYATLGNLEVIEEGPITGEALTHAKQKEKKWNQHMEKAQIETQQAYDPAK